MIFPPIVFPNLVENRVRIAENLVSCSVSYMVLYSQWFSGMSPFEGVRSVLVVVLEKMHDLFHEFLREKPYS